MKRIAAVLLLVAGCGAPEVVVSEVARPVEVKPPAAAATAAPIVPIAASAAATTATTPPNGSNPMPGEPDPTDPASSNPMPGVNAAAVDQTR
jgi:hypothetical protein